MEEPREQHSVEHDINDLRQSLGKQTGQGMRPSAEFVTEVTRAIQTIGEHLVALHRRLERLEDTQPEWTTRGWEPPPGADRNPDGASERR
jgi:hypothetical protein